jgi:hypothetical protein
MLRWIGLLLLCLTVPAATGTARAALLTPIPQPAGAQCRPAIDAAERGTAIPPHLLAAIGRVESGRRDPQSGGWNPWPWTVNAEGEGFFFDTKEQAIAAVRTMQARGTRSIDVGCMQVNLMHHPDAFGSLEQAFDPASNAAYAARFLGELHGQSNDWLKAAAAYHSATPELGAEYQRKVVAAWPEESRVAVTAAVSPLAAAWGATLHGGMVTMSQAAGLLPTAKLGGAARILPQASINGVMIPGRGLDAYRAAPVALAMRLPRRIGG